MNGRHSLFVFLTGLALVTGMATAFVRGPHESVATGRSDAVPWEELLRTTDPVTERRLPSCPGTSRPSSGRLTLFADFSQRTSEEDLETVVDQTTTSTRGREGLYWGRPHTFRSLAGRMLILVCHF